jgi:hypothetical protein
MPKGGEALRHDPTHRCLERGYQQGVGVLGSQLAGLAENLVRAAAELAFASALAWCTIASGSSSSTASRTASASSGRPSPA